MGQSIWALPGATGGQIPLIGNDARLTICISLFPCLIKEVILRSQLSDLSYWDPDGILLSLTPFLSVGNCCQYSFACLQFCLPFKQWQNRLANIEPRNISHWGLPPKIPHSAFVKMLTVALFLLVAVKRAMDIVMSLEGWKAELRFLLLFSFLFFSFSLNS